MKDNTTDFEQDLLSQTKYWARSWSTETDQVLLFQTKNRERLPGPDQGPLSQTKFYLGQTKFYLGQTKVLWARPSSTWARPRSSEPDQVLPGPDQVLPGPDQGPLTKVHWARPILPVKILFLVIQDMIVNQDMMVNQDMIMFRNIMEEKCYAHQKARCWLFLCRTRGCYTKLQLSMFFNWSWCQRFGPTWPSADHITHTPTIMFRNIPTTT